MCKPIVGLLLSLTLLGCYNHRAAHTPIAVQAPGLPDVRSGHYIVTQGGIEVAQEFVTITSSAGWALKGRIEWSQPVAARTEYQLQVRSNEPVSLQVQLSLLGQTRTLTASVSDSFVHVRVDGLGPKLRRKVAYGAGTALDTVSPILRVWMLGLLTRRLLPGQSVAVRTLRFEAPHLNPKVELQTLEVQDVKDGLRLLKVVRAGPPEGLWVESDGFIVRARTWPRGRSEPFVERVWVADPPTPKSGALSPQ